MEYKVAHIVKELRIYASKAVQRILCIFLDKLATQTEFTFVGFNDEMNRDARRIPSIFRQN